MRKGLFYICLLLVGVGLFAGCKSKKAVVASFSDLDGEWGVVEMNGKTLNPEETHQVLVFDVARQGLSGNAGCNRLMGKIGTQHRSWYSYRQGISKRRGQFPESET